MATITKISEKRWQPNANVPQSGVYLMRHREQHSEAQEMVLLAGKQFPQCEVCQDDATFELVRTAPYVFHDDDFRTDDSRTDDADTNRP